MRQRFYQLLGALQKDSPAERVFVINAGRSVMISNQFEQDWGREVGPAGPGPLHLYPLEAGELRGYHSVSTFAQAYQVTRRWLRLGSWQLLLHYDHDEMTLEDYLHRQARRLALDMDMLNAITMEPIVGTPRYLRPDAQDDIIRQLYDRSTIRRLKFTKGTGESPFTRRPFTWADILPLPDSMWRK